jgi:hypothetical protein
MQAGVGQNMKTFDYVAEWEAAGAAMVVSGLYNEDSA